jgi:hypothetical protein
MRAFIGLAMLLLLAACNETWDDDSGPPGDDDSSPTDADPCDGVDNDGNGVIDDGHACAAGSTVACTAHGTCAGTAACSDQCTVGECSDPAWECTSPGSSEPCDGGLCNDAADCLPDCTMDACAPHCATDETCCDTGCVDLTSDVAHCGACNRPCEDELWGDPPQCFGGGCCLKGCRNGSEVCDDEHFSVPSPYTRMFLVCYNANGGVAYLATNTGLPCDDGISRCRGWEENGMDAWDHLQYVAQMDCTTAGSFMEVDLSGLEGVGMYIGVHDQPTGGGDMTAVCVAEGP